MQRTIPLMLAFVAGVAAPPASAAAPKRCDQLGGKNLVESTTIRVGYRAVQTKTSHKRVYYGCASPRGRAFKLGSNGTSDSGSTTKFALGKRAGRFLITRTSTDDAGGAGTGKISTQVHDLRSGARRILYDQPSAEGDVCQADPYVDGAPYKDADAYGPARLVISASGVVAGVYRPDGCVPVAEGARITVSVPGRKGLTTADRTGLRRRIPPPGPIDQRAQGLVDQSGDQEVRDLLRRALVDIGVARRALTASG